MSRTRTSDRRAADAMNAESERKSLIDPRCPEHPLHLQPCSMCALLAERKANPAPGAAPEATTPDCSCGPRDRRGWRDPHCQIHGEFPPALPAASPGAAPIGEGEPPKCRDEFSTCRANWPTQQAKWCGGCLRAEVASLTAQLSVAHELERQLWWSKQLLYRAESAEAQLAEERKQRNALAYDKSELIDDVAYLKAKLGERDATIAELVDQMREMGLVYYDDGVVPGFRNERAEKAEALCAQLQAEKESDAWYRGWQVAVKERDEARRAATELLDAVRVAKETVAEQAQALAQLRELAAAWRAVGDNYTAIQYEHAAAAIEAALKAQV